MRACLGLLVLLAPIASACGPSSTPTQSEERARDTSGDDVAAQPERSDPPPPARTARDLEIDATFLDLVAAARRQDDLRDQDSDAGCLVRSSPLRLSADLAAAVRPLPEPPPSLTARLESRVVVLTRYGAIGEPSAPLALAAFTTTRPAAGASAQVLVVTPRALYLGSTERPRFDEIDRSRLARLDDGTSQLFVTATAGMPVAELVAILGELPAMPGRVALAVPLPENTRLPEPPASTAETAPICQLTTPAEEALGELPISALREGVAPLIDRARLCAGTTDGPGALGGRVQLAMRIDARGRVIEACVTDDDTNDGALRACLVAAARELAFPAPTGGALDVALPFSIAPGPTHRQLALCE